MERIKGLEPSLPVWKTGVLTIKHYIRIMVREKGFEPSRCLHQRILSPLRLPIPPLPHMAAAVGFEPTGGFPPPDFKSGAINQTLPRCRMVLCNGIEPISIAYKAIALTSELTEHMVELMGIEPMTSCLQGKRSPI